MVNAKENEIVLKPVKTWDDLFGSVPGLDIKQLLKLREEEASYE